MTHKKREQNKTLYYNLAWHRLPANMAPGTKPGTIGEGFQTRGSREIYLAPCVVLVVLPFSAARGVPSYRHLVAPDTSYPVEWRGQSGPWRWFHSKGPELETRKGCIEAWHLDGKGWGIRFVLCIHAMSCSVGEGCLL